jgi:MFS family permease
VFESTAFVGSLFGYLISSYISDNFGKKKSMVIGLGVSVFGYSLIVFSQNIYMAIIGMIISSVGGDGCCNITYCFISDIVEDRARQKYIYLIQFMFGFGVLIAGALYYIVPHWRWNTLLVSFVPTIVSWYFLITYV